MKKTLFLVLLSALQVMATPVTCYQGDGDDRYRLKFDGDTMAIVFTNSSDESEVIYYDHAEYFKKSGTISGGRYIVNLNSNLKRDSSLYKLSGREKILLTDILECKKNKDNNISKWIKRFFE